MLCLLIFVAACSSSPDIGLDGEVAGAGGTQLPGAGRTAVGAGGQGRFVEYDITPPVDGEGLVITQTPGGTVVVFTQGLRARFDSIDGGASWTRTPGPGRDTDAFEGVSAIAYCLDRGLIGLMPQVGVVAISQDGGYEHIPIASIDEAIESGQTVNAQVMQVLAGGGLLMSYTASSFPFFGSGLQDVEIDLEALGVDLSNIELPEGGMMEFNTADGSVHGGGTGFRMHSGADGGVSAGAVQQAREVAASFGDGGLIAFGGATTIAIFDMSTGAVIEELEPRNAISVTGDRVFFLEHGQEIYQYVNGNMDMVIDGTAFAFGIQGNFVEDILLLPGEIARYVISVNINGSSRLFLYYWDENATIDPSKTITVWSLHDNATVRAAINELWRANPDAHITYEVALAGEDGAITAADAIRTLNTRLLSGTGPDVLILDGTPFENYAGRGMLMDLTGRISTADMYQNLLAAFVSDGGQLYTVPTQFRIPVLIGDADDIAGITSLAQLVHEVESGNPFSASQGIRRGGMFGNTPAHERSALAFDSLEELFDIMWLANSPAIITDNQLDAVAVREFLGVMQAISSMYDLGASPENPMFQVMSSVGMSRGGMTMVSPAGSLMHYITGAANMAAFSVDHLMLLQLTLDRGNADMLPFPGLADGAWEPSTVAGVSADTSSPDFAIELVNTLLSLDVQRMNNGQGLPITQAGLRYQVSAVNAQMADVGADVYLDIDLFDIIHDLNAPAILEDVLRNMIWTTVERLCDGTIDLDRAVQEIEQSLRNYLAERA